MADSNKLYTRIHYLKGTILELKNEIDELKCIVLEKETAADNLRTEMKAMKDSFDTNMECIKNILTNQSVHIKKITENLYPGPKFSALFPIKTQDELDNIEMLINEENQIEMVETVYHIIRNGGFKLNMRSLLAENVIMAHNIDGKQGKIPLLSYTKLMNVLIQAAQKIGLCEKLGLKQLRVGLKSVKNQHHKVNSMKRRKMEENE
ncbi:uncharacterized protein [Eurosta solidaginis]|uniref:uncharacterized protein n=1 Tax=Eurosta solidaginis TaxID=178769 RepID=UPI0035314EC4